MPKCSECRYYNGCLKALVKLPKKGCENYHSKKQTKKPSLCCDCSRLDCTWMRSLEPVAGWTAKKTDVGYIKTNGVFLSLPSYCVESCPGYTPGQNEKDKKKGT